MDYSLQMDSKVPIATDSTHTVYSTWQSWAGTYMESHPYVLVFLVYSEGYQTRCKYQHSHKTFDTHFVLSAEYARAMVAQNF